jgi:hypothetical protein
MTTKFERQGEILRLVQQHALSTQAEVAYALRAHGIDAVQETVWRDIAQLGLVKVRNADGRLVYALPAPTCVGSTSDRALRYYLGKNCVGLAPSCRRCGLRRRSPTRSIAGLGSGRHGRRRQHRLHRLPTASRRAAAELRSRM